MKKLICICLVLFAAAVVGWSQGTTSRISGVVTDAVGGVIPGAKVTAINDGTGASFTAVTSSSGTYAFDSLQPGRYTIAVSATGFKAYRSTGNVLSIGVPTSVDPKLQVGGNAETVEVQGGYDVVQTESSGNFGGDIETVAMTELPVVGTRGRNPLGMIEYMPGVVVNGANASGGGISVNGSRDRAWNYVLDGIDANESSSGGSNTSPPHQNPDMLAEIRVITAAPTAEFGRSSGAQVVMVTKSGTNELHGNAFWFYQTPFLRANSPVNKATGAARSQFIQNIPGASLSGPIWRNKAFFFFNVELLHVASSSSVTRTVYTATARTGLFRYATNGCRNLPYGSTTTTCTTSTVDANGNPQVAYSSYDMVANDPFQVGLDSTAKAFLAKAPTPNNFTTGDGLNYAGYSFVAPSNDKQVDTTFKFDYRFSDKNTAYFRWMGGHQNTYADSSNSGLQLFPGLPDTEDTYRFPRNIAINDRWSPNSKFTNEAVIGMNRFGYRFDEVNAVANEKTPYNPNLVTATLNSYYGNSRFLTTYQAVDNATYVHGAHIFKAGVNLRYGREIDERGSVGSYNANPQVTFSNSYNALNATYYKLPGSSAGINTTYDLVDLKSATDDLLGRAGAVQAGYVANKDLSSFKPAGTRNFMDARWPEYDFFIQDTWHVLPHLVIDLGVRDDVRLAPDFHTIPGMVPNQTPRYGQVLGSTLSFVHGAFMQDRWNNFGPSLGFAFDPKGDGKTSIRGNFRIAYDRINSFSFTSSVFQGMPGLLYQIANTTAGQDTFSTSGNTMGMRAAGWSVPVPTSTPKALLTPPTYSANALTVSDPGNMKTPTVNSWGLSVQRELMPNTVLTVSYIGNHAVHLYGGYDSNQSELYSNGFLDAFKTVAAGGTSALMSQIISSDTRYTAGQTAQSFINTNYSGYLTTNNVGALANALAQRLQNATTANPYGVPLVVSSGLSTTLFKPYSQYLGNLFVLETRGYSNYNGLQAQFDKRFSNGLLANVGYTYSKTLDTRSFDPAFTLVATGSSQSAAGTPFDYHTPRMNYAAADFDNTHVITGYWVYGLPFGHGARYLPNANRLADGLIGGWEFSGAGNWQSGRPLTLYSGSYTYAATVMSTPNCTGNCNAHMGHVHRESNGQIYWLTAAQRAQFSIPAAGTQGNIGRNWLRQNATWDVDASLAKSLRVTEKQSLQLRLEGQNIFNTVSYDTTGSQNIQSSVFMRLNAGTDGVINSSPRRFQLAAKYVF
jgi:hypothetical protein